MDINNYDDSLGETIYRLIPCVRSVVDRERLIQKWTRGISTDELIKRYINQNKTPLLEWNPSKKTYVLHVYKGIFVIQCDRKGGEYPQLLLNQLGEWEKRNLCSQCMTLFN